MIEFRKISENRLTKMPEFGIVPEWRFHQDETFFPICIKNILPFCHFDKTNQSVIHQNAAMNYRNAILWKPEQMKGVGENIGDRTPVYAHNFQCQWKNGETVFATQWILCYLHNPGVRPCFSCCKPSSIGAHHGDFEIVVCFYTTNERREQDFLGMLCLAHGLGDEARYYSQEKGEVVWHEGRPVVWVALGSHAHIGQPVSRCRFFFTQDCVQGEGMPWLPGQIIRARDEWWFQLAGRWGDPYDGPTTPQLFDESLYKLWMERQEKDKSGQFIHDMTFPSS